jgi:molybdate transport system regulatory protein
MSRPHLRNKRMLALVPRVKLWLECHGRYAFGLGVSEILLAVERAGSIKQAAHTLGKSYRYVWGRIKAAEKVLRQPLVKTQVGGKEAQRSRLTPPARQLAHAFLALRQDMIQIIEQQFRKRFASFL